MKHCWFWRRRMGLDKKQRKAQLKLVAQKRVQYDGCGNFVDDDEDAVDDTDDKLQQLMLLARSQ
eukprot:5018705-Ditylum_brightwellii.AAC.1